MASNGVQISVHSFIDQIFDPLYSIVQVKGFGNKIIAAIIAQ